MYHPKQYANSSGKGEKSNCAGGWGGGVSEWDWGGVGGSGVRAATARDGVSLRALPRIRSGRAGIFLWRFYPGLTPWSKKRFRPTGWDGEQVETGN